MPHICLITTVHHADDTRIFHKQAQALVGAGYRVTLLAQGAAETVRDGVQVLPLPPHRFSFWHRLHGLWTAWRRAVAQNADVYHLHDPELAVVGLLLKLGGRRVVMDLHEHVPYQIRQKSYIPAPLRRPLALFYDGWERVVTRWFDAVITVVPAIAARLGGRVVLVRNLPRVAAFFPADPARPGADGVITAVYVGTVEQHRGLLTLAQAVAALPPEVPLRLRIIGRCRFPDYADALRKAGDARVSLEPPIPHDDVPAVLAAAHIGVVLLHPTPLYCIAWPVKVFEYMAAGLPVLRSDFSGWAAFAAEGSMAVDPLDVGAITAALRQLVEDAELRARLGAAGRAAVEARFHWETEAAALLALYAELVGEAGDQ